MVLNRFELLLSVIFYCLIRIREKSIECMVRFDDKYGKCLIVSK